MRGVTEIINQTIDENDPIFKEESFNEFEFAITEWGTVVFSMYGGVGAFETSAFSVLGALIRRLYLAGYKKGKMENSKLQFVCKEDSQ